MTTNFQKYLKQIVHFHCENREVTEILDMSKKNGISVNRIVILPGSRIDQ